MAEDPITEAHRSVDRSRRELIEQVRGFVEKGHAAQQRVTFPVGTQKTVASLNVILFIGFIVGVAFLCSFVGVNLSYDKSRGPKAPAVPKQAMQRTADRSDI